MSINLSKVDIIWSYVGTILSMSANVLMLPVIVYYLDSDMLGLWYVFASIGGIAVLFDFGFGVTFARNITYSWSGASKLQKKDVNFADNTEPNFILMKKVLKACKIVYLSISSFSLLILLSLGTAYVVRITKNIEGYSHIVAWIIYSIAVFLNLFYGYYSSFLRGVGAVGDANKNIVIARCFQIAMTIIFLALGWGIVGVSCAYFIYGYVFRYLGKYKFYRFNNIGFQLSLVREKTSSAELITLFKTVWYNGWREGLISIANYLSGYASTIICSMFLSLAETGSYSIGVQMAMAVSVISGTLYSAMQPQLQSAYIHHDIVKIRKTMAAILTSFFYLYIIGFVLVILVLVPILRFIKPESIISFPILFLLFVYYFILKFRDCYASYFSSTNRILYLNSFLISSIMCLALSILFAGPLKMGVWGIVIAQIISQLFYNVWYWMWKGNQEMETNLLSLFYIGNGSLWDQVKKSFPLIK